MTASELLQSIQTRLKQAQIIDARFEARMIAAHVLDVDAAQLSPVSTIPVTAQMCEQAESLVQRRIAGEPLQYLLGKWAFMGLPFYVSEGVLIPRADTEILCEKALDLIRERGYRTVLDLCCGTGCIGISLAKISCVSVTLGDISETCISLARKNAELNDVSVSIIKTDMFSALNEQQFDLICCNPPYLTEEDMLALQKEVCYEPSLALYGGKDGLDFYRRIAADFRKHLRSNGALLLEIGSTQADAVADLFGSDTVWKDYAGNSRVVFVEA